MGSLYLGAIITALAAPELLAAAGVIDGRASGRPAWASRSCSSPRSARHRARAGVQAALGAILFAIGASNLRSRACPT